MTTIRIVLFLCGLGNLAFAVYAWFRHTYKLTHMCFSGVVVFWALWNFSCFFIAGTKSEMVLNYAGRLSFAAGLGVAGCYLTLTWLFPEELRRLPKRSVLYCVIGITALLALLTLFTPLVQSGVQLTPEIKKPTYGILFPVYVVYIVCLFIWSNYNLVRSRARLSPGRARMQVNYMLSGFVLAFTTVTIIHFIVAPFFDIQQELPAVLIAVIFATIAVILTNGYAIYRHRLMDIGLAARNLFIYFFIAVFVACIVGDGLLLYVVLLRQLTFIDQVIVIVMYSGVCAALIIPFHSVVKDFVDRRLFKGRFDPRYVVTDFGNRLMRCYGWQEIADVSVQQIKTMMNPERVLVYLVDHDQDGDKSLQLVSSSQKKDGEKLAIPQKLAEGGRLTNELTIRASREAGYGTKGVLDIFTSPHDISRELEELGATVAFPIKLNTQIADRNDLIGAIFLGEPAQENTYTREDLRLLQAMAFEAAVVLNNAKLHEDLLASHRHYKAILEHMQRGVVAVDKGLNIITLNKAAANILGVDWYAVNEENINNLVPEFSAFLEDALQGKSGRVDREITVKRDDKKIPCGCETSSLDGEKTGKSGALIVFEDLTEKKRFEAEVRRVDRLASVGTLAAGVAHEIKNPLVSIQTFAQLLPQRYMDDEFRNNFGGVVRNEIDRINKLIRSLLDFARPNQDNTGEVYIQELLERATTLLESEFKKNKIEVGKNIEDDLPPTTGDSEQLFQVIFNLLQNSIQAIDGDNGKIEIDASVCNSKSKSERRRKSSDKALCLEIRDNGCGIDEEHLAHIFDPFYSTKSDGSGLGLSICHSILEEHDAGIEVDSTVGAGTVFRIMFSIDGKGANQAQDQQE